MKTRKHLAITLITSLMCAAAATAQTNPYVLIEDFDGSSTTTWSGYNSYIAPPGDCGNPSGTLTFSDSPGSCQIGAYASPGWYTALSSQVISFHPSQTMEFLYDIRNDVPFALSGGDHLLGKFVSAPPSVYNEGWFMVETGDHITFPGDDQWRSMGGPMYYPPYMAPIHESTFKLYYALPDAVILPSSQPGGFYMDNIIVRPAGNGTAFCGGIACPCGNTATSSVVRGCVNSTGKGAWLHGYGDTSLVANEIEFVAAELVPGQPALLFQGTSAINGGSGLPFGDGLRCVGGSVQRLSTQLPDSSGIATWTGSSALAGWSAGQTSRVQVYYRDPVGSPCGAGFNTTNGYELTFTP